MATAAAGLARDCGSGGGRRPARVVGAATGPRGSTGRALLRQRAAAGAPRRAAAGAGRHAVAVAALAGVRGRDGRRPRRGAAPRASRPARRSLLCRARRRRRHRRGHRRSGATALRAAAARAGVLRLRAAAARAAGAGLAPARARRAGRAGLPLSRRPAAAPAAPASGRRRAPGARQSGAVSGSSGDLSELRRAQEQMRGDGDALVRVDAPFLLDFSGRRLFVIDHPCAASPAPGIPCDGDAESLHAYLLARGIRWVLYSRRPPEWLAARRRAAESHHAGSTRSTIAGRSSTKSCARSRAPPASRSSPTSSR